MLDIYIARHGQNIDNAKGILNGHRDLALTEIGIHQAHTLAKSISENCLLFDSIYTSPLKRAYETASIIARTLGLDDPQVLPSIIERDFGVMTGKPADQIEELCSPEIVKTDTITYFLSPEGAETFPELLARAQGAIAEIQGTHTDGTVLLVTHGDIGKMLYASYYQLPWMQLLTMFHFGNSDLLLLSENSKPEDSHVIHIDQHNH